MLSSISASGWDYGILGVYLVLVIGIGVWHSRKENTSEDFLLGGRKMPWLAVGISYMMSLLSTYSLVMIPGEIYSHGLSMWVLCLLTPLFSIGAFFLFMRFYFKMSVYTPYEYLGRRYGQSVRLLVSIQYLFGKVIYLGIVLFSVSIIFENVLGWPVWITMIVVGIVSMIYTVLGGLKAVIWTDVLQFFILAIGLLLAVGMCIYKVKGGLPAILSISFEHGRGFTQYAELEFYNLNPYIRLCFWFLMLAPITGALNEASFNQISIQRLLSTGSIWQAQKSIFVNAALGLPLTLILWVIGLGMYVFYYQNPDPTITSGDAALFKFISTQMPTPMPGLLVATMLAAAMSTLDSGLNSISTVLVKDFYIRYINKTASERKQVKMSRVLVMVIGVIMISVGVLSYLSAETFGQSLVEVGTVFGILEVVMLPAFVFAIFSKRVTTSIIWLTAAICWGMNTGGVHWYSASNNVDNPLIGAIPFSYVLKPLIAAAVLAAISILFRKLKRQFFAQLFTGFWLFFAGYTSMIFFWYLCAKYLGGGKLSFQWPCTPGFVCFFLFGTIAIKIWGKTPESSRYVGLTMGTCKEEMQKDSGLNM